MPKALHCSDIMPGCDFVARGSTEEEVLAQGAAHAREKHGLTEVTPDMVNRVRSLIRDEKAGAASH